MLELILSNHNIKSKIMLTEINPKIPMRDKSITKEFYTKKLGFKVYGNPDHEDYLMMKKDRIQIHFFQFKALDPKENYGQVYIRTDNIEEFYKDLIDRKKQMTVLSASKNLNTLYSNLDSDNFVLISTRDYSEPLLKQLCDKL